MNSKNRYNKVIIFHLAKKNSAINTYIEAELNSVKGLLNIIPLEIEKLIRHLDRRLLSSYFFQMVRKLQHRLL